MRISAKIESVDIFHVYVSSVMARVPGTLKICKPERLKSDNNSDLKSQPSTRERSSCLDAINDARRSAAVFRLTRDIEDRVR